MNGGRDPSPQEVMKFGDHLLRYIEADQAGRELGFVGFIQRWFEA